MVQAKRRLPEWFKVQAPTSGNFNELKSKITGAKLNTVCEEAACPNIGECWDSGTATFMILGDVCTRACRYCNVKTGKPTEFDLFEPTRVATTVKEMNLSYAVITSVDRDDLVDGGSGAFAMTINQIKKFNKDTKVEVLIPDFNGNVSALQTVLASEPDVINHNIESCRRVFRNVRPRGDYDQSIELLKRVKDSIFDIPTKSGMMVGLGETEQEIIETMKDLRSVNCDLITIGQYLRPSKKHVKIEKFYHPKEFNKFKEIGLELGFKHVASGPLVRSSYHADQQHRAAKSS
jgi:lipoic acid synthetase